MRDLPPSRAAAHGLALLLLALVVRAPDAGASAAKGAAPPAGCDGSSRYAYGGLDGMVFAQAVFDDGSGAALYAGGDFITAGGVTVNGVARWDGTSWSALGTGVNDSVVALAVFDDGSGAALYAGGFFTTAGGVPAAGVARWDGAAWSPLGAGVDDSVYALAVFDDGTGPGLYAGGYFSFAGGAPAANIARWDGAAWSPLGAGVDDEVDALAVFDDGTGPALYAGGFFTFAGGTPAGGIAKWDGAAWSPLGFGTDGGVLALQVFDDGGGAKLYAGGFFTFAGGLPVFGIAAWDGLAWSDLDGGTNGPVLALTTFDDGGGTALYAGGFFTEAGSTPVDSPGVARWDGAAWSDVGGGLGEPSDVYSLTVFDDGTGAALYAGGFFFEAGGTTAGFLAAWDGAAWSGVFPTGPDFEGLDGPVLAFQVFDDGTGPALYVGGRFRIAGDVTVNGIARWDGASWSALGSGLECLGFGIPMATSAPTKGLPPPPPPGCFFASVEALAVFDDGGGPALYAGGVFERAGGDPAANVARWDGTSWSPLGTGTDDVVEALAVFDDGGGPDLYAGGEFGFAGGLPASNLARWDGAAWSTLGAADGDVETLAVFDDGGGPDLYAGGEFDVIGGVAAAKIARWDGVLWSTLGAGMDDEVETLFAWDDGGGADLYAGGQFGTAGGLAAPSIARWDGSAWSTLGTGMGSTVGFRTVDALAAFDDGTGVDLYAGGFFDTAGGAPAANLARWDGSAWSALGAGTDEEVEALAAFSVDAPSLYAGGFFGMAGGVASSFIGEWRCAPPTLSIDDVTLPEGDGGTTDFVFTVTRSHAANPVSVDVATADGSADAGADYTALPATPLAFADGALTATVTVAVVADTVEEPTPEVFFVDLSNPMGATILDGQGVGTILDDDDDTGAPAVVGVDSDAGTGDGTLAECEEARVTITRLRVTFDQAMNDPAGDDAGDDVTHPANYRVFAAGADRDLTSAACAAPAGDDAEVTIDAVTYDAGTFTATLDLGEPLADEAHRLVACGSLADPAGNPLAGGDFVRTFRVERRNLFVNGQLDCDLGGWTPVSTDPGAIVHGGGDVDGASVSGSATITNPTSSTEFSLGQCVPVAGGSSYELRGALRLAAAGADLFLNRVCEMFAAAGCTGASLESTIDVFPIEDTAGAWEPVSSTIPSPPGAASAFCGFTVTAPGGDGFTAGLDDLEFLEIGAIFADGFESGDTSSWSVTVP